MATYKGAFVRYFCDAVNEARDNELRNVFRRREAVEQVLSKLGLSISGMQRKIHVKDVSRRDGQDFTVDQVLSIYCGLKNTKSAKAILFGNLGYYGDNAQAVANALIAQLTEAEKSAGDMIMADYEREFERLNNAFIDAYNQGMEHEENYTPMRRLEYTTNEGLLDADTGEALMNARASAGGLGEVEGGFLISRRDINEEGQRAIDLGLFEIWLGQVDRQEHAAAFAALLSELKSVIASHGQDMKLKNMVTQAYGKPAWKGVIDYYNIIARDERAIAHDVLDKVSATIGKGMSVTYLCYNFGTVLIQTASLPRILAYAGPIHILSAIVEFSANPSKFLKTVYELDPQLKDRKGNTMLRHLRKSNKIIDMGMVPIAFMDRMTAAVAWKAAYNANRARGLSERDSIREAQRAVLLTQQITHAKDESQIWRTSRFTRLGMIFASDVAQIWGMSTYDLAQRILRGDIPAAFSAVLAITLSAMMTKLLRDGPPDDDEEETWEGWIASAVGRQEIEAVPVIGRELMSAYDARLGDRRWSGSHYSAFVAPIDKLLYSATHMQDEFGDVNERAIWNILEAAAVITGKFPATATRRLWESGKAVMDDDLQFAVMNMLGMKRWMKDRLRY